MSARAKRHLQQLRSSLWPLPVLAIVAGTGVGLALPHLDESGFLHDLLSRAPILAPVLEVEGSSAQSILATIAGALATVLGVLFSITIVALQLASSQYSPRVLRRFRGDRTSQVVLASLVGTVAFLVVVLPGLPQEAHPRLTLLCALLLTLICLGLVAYFLHHLARQIDTPTIVRHIRIDTIAVIRKLKMHDIEATWVEGEGESFLLRADDAGYLEACDEEVIFAAMPPGTRLLRMEARVGDFIIPGLPLLQIWPGEAVDERSQGRLRRAFVLAQQRTLEQDVLFGVRQLVDVGLKALSAAINDVTTAVMAVNELGLVLQAFQERGPIVVDGWRRERRGGCTLDVPILGLRSMLRHSFDEVARAAGPQLRVSARMLEVMEQVIEATRPDDAQRAAYSRAARWIESSARLDGATSVEREYFDERYRSLLRRAAGITLPGEEPALH